MSTFYGTVEGSARTAATRRGNHSIKVAAQSWNGSIITRLYYQGDTLMVNVDYSTGSATYGYELFDGTFDEFVEVLKGAKK